MTWVHLTPVSGNRKVGKIPVTTSDKNSCPNQCPLKDTDCYARFGPLGMHWSKVGPNGRGGNWQGFCNRVRKFRKNQLWRHNQAGDLPKDENLSDENMDRLDSEMCAELADAADHTDGWTYTHYDVSDSHNREVVRSMNEKNGLTVNISADSLDEADKYFKMNIGPVVVNVPENTPHSGNKTPDGIPMVICPAQTQEDMSCDQCRLCQVRDRKSIVAFLAHGTAKKRLSRKLEE